MHFGSTTDRPEQGTFGDRGRGLPATGPRDGVQADESVIGVRAVLIGLGVGHMQQPGVSASVVALQVLDMDGHRLGLPTQRVRGQRKQGGITQVTRTVAQRGENGRDADAVELAGLLRPPAMCTRPTVYR